MCYKSIIDIEMDRVFFIDWFGDFLFYKWVFFVGRELINIGDLDLEGLFFLVLFSDFN